jgi:hypothetical protein
MNDDLHDVRPELYASVVREMLRHENDLTNHRIMWLLIGQGFIANAFISAKDRISMGPPLALLGLFLSLSAFVMLYRSYQARGYLKCLGERAKKGTLQEKQLPILGWPAERLRGWSGEVWAHPWLAKYSDLLEPWVFLPYLFGCLWLAGMLRSGMGLDTGIATMLAAVLSTVIFVVVGGAMVWSWVKEEGAAGV